MTSPRANRDGHPCPPWCTADHDEQIIPGYYLKAHSGDSIPVDGDVFWSARPCLAPAWGESRVQVGSRTGSFYLSDADRLADLIGQLATATPEQHRELAAAIRAAAQTIKGDGTDDPDTGSPGRVGR